MPLVLAAAGAVAAAVLWRALGPTFADPLFETAEVKTSDVRDLAATLPSVAKAVIGPESDLDKEYLVRVTGDNTEKTDEVRGDRRVLLAYSDPKSQSYVSISGTARVSAARSTVRCRTAAPIRSAPAPVSSMPSAGAASGLPATIDSLSMQAGYLIFLAQVNTLGDTAAATFVTSDNGTSTVCSFAK